MATPPPNPPPRRRPGPAAASPRPRRQPGQTRRPKVAQSTAHPPGHRRGPAATAAAGRSPLPAPDRQRYRSGVDLRRLLGLGLIVLTVLGLRWALTRETVPRLAGEEADPAATRLAPPEPPPFSPIAVDESQPEPAVQTIVDDYVARLADAGFVAGEQGVWVQQGDRLLAQNAGRTRLPAASLTKLATTLLAVDRWEPDYKFVTRLGITGPIEAGVLQGDLVLFGGGDPMFVWESAFALGHSLNQLGIREVAGDLRVSGVLAMNFERDRPYAAGLFREGLDSANWPWQAVDEYAALPPGTPQPQVTIRGQTLVSEAIDPSGIQIVAEHYSLPMQELLKRMNMYSNNIMADLLADLLGGAPALEAQTIALAQVPPEEVQFINGSGLGQENQTSPRASCRILDVIGQKLEPHGLGLKDVLPIVPLDKGTLEGRKLPSGLIGKTGTLSDVSNLAGMLPLAGQPVMYLEQPQSICFAIHNRGWDLNYFYDQQEVVIEALGAATTNEVQAQTQVP